MTTQQQEQILDEWLHGANHDFAQVQEISASLQRQAANRGEERTVTVQQQQEPILAMTGSQWNAWFEASFKNFMESHIKAVKKAFRQIEHNMRVIDKAIGGKTETDADGKGKVTTLPLLGDDVQALEKNIQFIAKLLGGETDADGKMKLPKLDDIIDRRVEKILKERAERGSKISKTVGIIDQILAA